jgi:hypothetical protein
VCRGERLVAGVLIRAAQQRCRRTGVRGGKPQTISDVAADPDYIRIGPEVVAEICVPILDRAGQPIGVLNAEWTSNDGLDGWQDLLSEVGRQLGARIEELGGPPAETRGERCFATRSGSPRPTTTTRCSRKPAAPRAR